MYILVKRCWIIYSYFIIVYQAHSIVDEIFILFLLEVWGFLSIVLIRGFSFWVVPAWRFCLKGVFSKDPGISLG